MITSLQDYNSHLHLIYNQNPPTLAQLPIGELIYNIDINSRTIEAPRFLGVEKDHKAETIYFNVNRYADYMDLSTTACVIYYINANGEPGIYVPNFYDIFTKYETNEMLIPWCLSQHVTAKKGAVQFSIRFFKTETQLSPASPSGEPIITYDLNLIPSTTMVLEGVNVDGEQFDSTTEERPANWYETIWAEIIKLNNNTALSWGILND